MRQASWFKIECHIVTYIAVKLITSRRSPSARSLERYVQVQQHRILVTSTLRNHTAWVNNSEYARVTFDQ